MHSDSMTPTQHVAALMDARVAAEEALAALGLRVLCEPEQVIPDGQLFKHVVYKAKVAKSGQDEIDVAVRVIASIGPAQDQNERGEWRIAHALAGAGAPTPRPLHEDLLFLDGHVVGVWEWIEPSVEPVSLRAWGRALRGLHEAGDRMLASGKYEIRRCTQLNHDFDLVRMRQLAQAPDHPLCSRPEVIDRFENSYNNALQLAFAASAVGKQGLVHGDVHQLNCLGAPLKLIDLEFAGVGPIANDFSIPMVGKRRYGWPEHYLDWFFEGYGHDGVPSLDEMEPFIRLRELVFLGWMMQYGNLSSSHVLELEMRLPVIDDPHSAHAPWVNPYDPELMDPALLSA